jgi:hypothetical protein
LSDWNWWDFKWIFGWTTIFWVSFFNFGNCFVRSIDGWVFCEEWPQFAWFVDSWKNSHFNRSIP